VRWCGISAGGSGDSTPVGCKNQHCSWDSGSHAAKLRQVSAPSTAT
jgi:hypothetical protein